AATNLRAYASGNAWVLEGSIANQGGRPHLGGRVVQFQRLMRVWGVPRWITLTSRSVPRIAPGGEGRTSFTLPWHPIEGTSFRILISPGDLDPDNDQFRMEFYERNALP